MLKLQIEEGSLEESDPEEDSPDIDDVSSLNSNASCIPPSGNIGELTDQVQNNFVSFKTKILEYLEVLWVIFLVASSMFFGMPYLS